MFSLFAEPRIHWLNWLPNHENSGKVTIFFTFSSKKYSYDTIALFWHRLFTMPQTNSCLDRDQDQSSSVVSCKDHSFNWRAIQMITDSLLLILPTITILCNPISLLILFSHKILGNIYCSLYVWTYHQYWKIIWLRW